IAVALIAIRTVFGIVLFPVVRSVVIPIAIGIRVIRNSINYRAGKEPAAGAMVEPVPPGMPPGYRGDTATEPSRNVIWRETIRSERTMGGYAGRNSGGAAKMSSETVGRNRSRNARLMHVLGMERGN